MFQKLSKTVSKQVTPSGWKLAPSTAGTLNTGRGRRTQGGGSRTPSCPSSGPVNKELRRSGPGDLKYRSRKVQLPWDRKSKRAPASTPAEDKGQASTPDDGTDPFQSTGGHFGRLGASSRLHSGSMQHPLIISQAGTFVGTIWQLFHWGGS